MPSGSTAYGRNHSTIAENMNPLELRVRNFMSYRDEAILDFSRFQVACFAGDNGSGKSALLDAITWALWGKTRASSDRDVIALGAPDMEVTFAFRLSDRDYRVMRRRTAGTSSRQTLELDVRAAGAGNWLSISGDNVRGTERKIIELLNLDYDTFVNSAFLLQGRADSFSQIGATDRKKILAEILNLSEYDQLHQHARDEERTVRTLLAQAEGRRDALDAALAERPARLIELEHASLHLTEISERLDRTSELLRNIRAQLAGWELLRDSLNAALAREQRARTAAEHVAATLAERRTSRDRYLTMLADAATIETGAAEHARRRKQAAQLGELSLLVRRDEQALEHAERALERVEADLRSQVERHQSQQSRMRQTLQVLELEAARLSDLQLEEQATAQRIGVLPSVRAERELLRTEQSTLQTDNNVRMQRMHEIQERIKQVQGVGSNCPVCRTPLPEPARERIVAEWTEEGVGLGVEYRAVRTRIEEMAATDHTLQASELELVALDRTHAALLLHVERASEAARTRLTVEAELQALEHELAPLVSALTSGTFGAEERERCAIARAALANHAYDRAAHDDAIAQERALAHWEEQLRNLERAKIELAGLERQIIADQELLAERERETEQAAREVAALTVQVEGQPDLRRQAELLSDEYDRLDMEKNDAQAAFGRVQGVLAELDRHAIERDEVAEQVRQLALDAGALRELILAFGSNGIQALIVDSVLPEIQQEANDILRRMSAGALHVSLRTQREAVSNNRMIETLDIIIRDEHGERPYALYSGGEAFRINFAVRVALSKLLSKRAGSHVDFLVIDEGFGSQDSRGRDGLIEALRSIEADFGTIVVITHLSEIRDMFPTRVDIAKTDRGSTITVVDS